ncbi:MAG: hypothetical protein J7L51_00155 [Desulfurococcales archaeon]|nr:hypothetical protein [Desulfurococcales archaeon]
MSAARIRLRYATLINYASTIYRMLVAIGFVVVVARRLSVSEFGLWGIMLSASLMLSMPVSIWAFWSRRYYVRGKPEASGTGVWLTLIYSVPLTLAYIGLAYFENYVIGWGLTELLIALPIPLLMAMDTYLTAFSAVIKPELVGYKRVVYETLRLAVAYVTVVILGFRYVGAVLALAVALLTAIIFSVGVLIKYNAINLKFSLRLVKEWFKASYVPLIGIVNGFLRNALRVIASWVTGSEVPAAYLNVALAAQSPMQASGAAATPALYARMLRERRASDVEESMRLLFLTGMYMLVIFTALSKPIASLYSPQYVEVSILIVITALYSLVNALFSVCSAALTGAELVDVEGIKSHREIIHSSLFKVPLVALLATVSAYAISIPSGYILSANYLLVASLFLLAFLLTSVASFVVIYRMAVKEMAFKFPIREALATAISAILMAIYFLALKVNDVTVTRFWTDAPYLLIHIIIGSLIYVATLALTSKWFRSLLKSAFTAVRSGTI